MAGPDRRADSGESAVDGRAASREEPSRSVAPSEGAVVRDRFSSDEVFQRIVAAADEELTSSRRELFFSGVAAGLAITTAGGKAARPESPACRTGGIPRPASGRWPSDRMSDIPLFRGTS